MNQRETFILKLLRIRQHQGWHISFSLRNIKSDEAQTFGSAEELMAYLADGTENQQKSWYNSDQHNDE